MNPPCTIRSPSLRYFPACERELLRHVLARLMKKSGCLMVFLFVAVCASMFVNLILLATLGAREPPGWPGAKLLKPKTVEERILVDGSEPSKVAVIPLDGVIAFGAAGSLGNSMVDDFKAALEQAENDKQIKSVVLQVDSPGGEITASDVLYDAICRLARHKPVVVYFDSMEHPEPTTPPAGRIGSCATTRHSPAASA